MLVTPHLPTVFFCGTMCRRCVFPDAADCFFRESVSSESFALLIKKPVISMESVLLYYELVARHKALRSYSSSLHATLFCMMEVENVSTTALCLFCGLVTYFLLRLKTINSDNSIVNN